MQPASSSGGRGGANAGAGAGAGAGADADELARLRRLHTLDALLPTLTRVLDLRDVLPRVSEIAKRALPHDLLGVATLADDDRTVRVYAVTGSAIPADVPGQMTREEAAFPPEPWDHTIVADLERASGADLPRTIREAARRLGLRSMLRLPVRFDGRLAGVVNFTAREPGLYGEDDLAAAMRIRDLIALALSHQRLAELRERLVEERARSARAEERVRTLTTDLDAASGYGRIVGSSALWQRTLDEAAKVAPTDATALITGESGAGKEVIARAIHRGSRRAAGPFVAINCAALPEALLESELFGFERGAFSGAVEPRAGRIEQAAGGTLFLDEIGEMSPAVQAKVLRFLEQREVQRLGAGQSTRADVRVIAATNRDLRSGGFREDLYYRVAVFEIRAPSLRERPDDILPLARLFLAAFAAAAGRPAPAIAEAAEERLLAHTWPGNARELRNAMERASILAGGGPVGPEHLALPVRASGAGVGAGGGVGVGVGAGATATASAPPPAAAPRRAGVESAGDGRSTVPLATLERAAIERALADAGFNKSRAAKRLGLSRGQLYQRLRRYGIDATPPSDGAAEP